MLAWSEVSDEFAWEGSWRDICITDTSISDWQATWEMLRSGDRDLNYFVDGENAAPPENVVEIFARPRERTFLLAVLVAGARLNCHFFCELEIEFDLDPRQIVGQAQLDAVLAFMADLAAVTGKISTMTPENAHDAPFLSVTPSAKSKYISTHGFFRDLAFQKP